MLHDIHCFGCIDAEKTAGRIFNSQLIQVVAVRISEVDNNGLIARTEKCLMIGRQIDKLSWHLKRMSLPNVDADFYFR